MYIDISDNISGDIMEPHQKKGIKLIILDILKNEKLHGYGIAEKIEKIYGIDKPGSGIIYTTLSNLRKKGLIRVCGEGRREKKIYTITERGMDYLKDHGSDLEKAQRMLKNLGEFYRIGGKEALEAVGKTIRVMHALTPEERRRVEDILKDFRYKLEDLTGEIDE